MSKSQPGKFVVLEGIDGSGSTTQVRRLAEALSTPEREVVTTCEPTPGPIGVLIRQALQHRLTDPQTRAPKQLSWSCMALLFAADRLDHVATTIEPALARGALVLSDRYYLSSFAYQSLTAPDADEALPWVVELNRKARRPDLTLVLDVAPEQAAQRRLQRGGPEELFEAAELQRRLASLYNKAEQLIPGEPLVHIDASDRPEAITERLLVALRKHGIV